MTINKSFSEKFIAIQGSVDNYAFAERLGCKEGSVRRYRKGHVPNKPETLKNLAEIGGTTIEKLLTEPPKATPTKVKKGIIDKSTKYQPSQPHDGLTPHGVAENLDSPEMYAFKNKCYSNLDHLFEYIADDYGMDATAIQDFLDDLRDVHHNYRNWRREQRDKRKASKE